MHDNHWSPTQLGDGSHSDEMSFCNDVITNILYIDIMLYLVCHFDDLTINMSNATVGMEVDESTMFLKMRCQYAEKTCTYVCEAVQILSFVIL